MTSRERVIKTLTFDSPDRAPRDLWALPGVGMLRPDEERQVHERFPSDFAAPRYRYGVSNRARGNMAEVGTYVDDWGSEWSVAEIGVVGEVKNPPLADWSALDSWSVPWELLEGADLSEVDASCRESDKFMRVGTHTRPFERMPDELYRLRDMLHEFSVAEMKMWADTAVDGVCFMDDWGTQFSLLIDPSVWRSFFKPLYKDYCDILKATGKYVFFHSDGHIEAIIPDLIEIGVDALNSQLFCMNIEEIARHHKGKITFWGEICRQHILPFGSVEEVRAAVRRVRSAMDDGKGGVIAQCEWGVRDPRENIEAVFETWLEPLDQLPG